MVIALPVSPLPCDNACAKAIVQSARSFVSTRTYPAGIGYDVRVALHKQSGAEDTRTYHSAYDFTNGVFYVKSISAEEDAHPYVPHGTDVVISFGGFGKKLGRPGSDPDVLGVPELSPTYLFGLRRAVSAPTESNSTLSTIGRISANTAEYEVAYVGDEDIANEPCAHIRLVPIRLSPNSRLRDLWVARSDDAPLMARTQGNFTAGPWDGMDWTIHFRRDGNALYIVSEETETEVVLKQPMRQGRVIVSFERLTSIDPFRGFLFSQPPRKAVREP